MLMAPDAEPRLASPSNRSACSQAFARAPLPCPVCPLARHERRTGERPMAAGVHHAEPFLTLTGQRARRLERPESTRGEK